MKKPLLVISFVLLLVVAFVGGFRFNQSANNGLTDSGDRKILHYVDPMNPANTSKEPGIAPCGMPMEPVYADEVDGGAGLGLPAGVVKLNETRRQLIGVQTAEVTSTSQTASLRVLGKVTPDENKVYAIVSGTDGWMGEIHDSTTGSIVREGQLMGKIRIYDYDFYTWQQRYLTELGNAGRRRVYISPLSGMSKEVERAARARREAGALLPDPGAPISLPRKDQNQMHDGIDARAIPGPPMETPHDAQQPADEKDQQKSPAPPTAYGIPPGTLYYGDGAQPEGNPDDIMVDILREKEKIPELPDGPAPEMPDTPVADLPMEMAGPENGPDSDMTGPEAKHKTAHKSPHMAASKAEDAGKTIAMEHAPADMEKAKDASAGHDHAAMSMPAPATAKSDMQSQMMAKQPQQDPGRMSPANRGKNPAHQRSGKHYFTGEDDILYASKARQELLDLGVSDAQLEELADTGVYVTSVQLYSPVDGLLLSRNVTSRQKIDRGQECFRIADVSTVWVEAEVFDIEERLLPPGTVAKVSLPNLGEHRMAKVTEVLPYFTEDSRILKVRLEMENSDFQFRPDMFVDVDFLLPLQAAITVPASAVIDSGSHAVVYVAGEEGVFEPRIVETGWRFNNRVEITDGLDQGEQIVVSGNFLIDSESRMKLAAARLMDNSAEPASATAPRMHSGRALPTVMTNMVGDDRKVVDPICGMRIDPETARGDDLTAEFNGQTYYFCSEECLEDFYRHGPKIEGTAIPEKPVNDAMDMPATHDQHMAGDGSAMQMPTQENTAEDQKTARDPVCDMDVDILQALSTDLKSEYEGETYYFCSAYCKDRFDHSPLDFVDGQMSAGGSGHEGHNHD